MIQMRKMWNQFREHPVAWALIALFWLLLQGQYFPRLWHASQNGPDPIRGVFNVHLLLPLIAGCAVLLAAKRVATENHHRHVRRHHRLCC